MPTAPANLEAATDTVRVTSKTTVAEGVVALTLRHVAGRRLPDWAPGAHVDLMLPNGLTKQYSLCGDRWDAHTYRVAVLREPHGAGGSAYVHDTLVEGDLVGIGGPRNNFHLAPSQRFLFIAGGIGITPLLPMIAQADILGADWSLLYGGRSRRSMAFVDELAKYGDRVAIAPQDEVGLLDLPSWLGRAAEAGSKVYACGPAPLLQAIESNWAGCPVNDLRTERFVACELAAPAREVPFQVELSRSGISVQVPLHTTVLDAVQAAGVNVLSSCREGTCGTCETTVLSGVPDHRDSILEDHERAAGDCMFICVSRACSDQLVLDL